MLRNIFWCKILWYFLTISWSWLHFDSRHLLHFDDENFRLVRIIDLISVHSELQHFWHWLCSHTDTWTPENKFFRFYFLKWHLSNMNGGANVPTRYDGPKFCSSLWFDILVQSAPKFWSFSYLIGPKHGATLWSEIIWSSLRSDILVRNSIVRSIFPRCSPIRRTGPSPVRSVFLQKMHCRNGPVTINCSEFGSVHIFRKWIYEPK